jgi:CheY-like chemotaxis protein
LVIDDMPGARRAVVSMLKHIGHTVSVASDGAEGIEKLKQLRFDLVICDVMMPQVDGTAVMSYIATLPNRPPVLAISGAGGVFSASETLQTARIKADAFLEKPFDKDRFNELVAKLLKPT